MGVNYSSNSLKNRNENTQEKPEVKKVTKGAVKKRKKSEMSKIASNIISQEATSIKDYAIYEVVIPVIKDTITQLIKGSIDMLFYGEVRHSSGRSRGYGTNASKISYRDYYDDRNYRDRESRRMNQPVVGTDDIEFTSREDAEEVLNRMDEIAEQYGVVRLADFFELAGDSGNGHPDQNYGWTSTRNAQVYRNRWGTYSIKIARPSSIR